MNSFASRNLLALLLSLAVFAGTACAHERILGGDFYNLFESPVALIATPDYLCSGILVGPREVLTAAHCISAETEDYLVAVGGEFYSASEAWFNSNYEPRGDIFRNMAHDTGLLVLDRPVGIEPVPVITDLPLERAQTFVSYGYGTNESSGIPGKSPLENGKGALMSISAIIPGFFQSAYENDRAAICSGDSGGPAIIQLGNVLAVIGINSAGSTKDSKGNCEVGGGDSLFVDLQARSSVQFLSNFASIQRVSGRSILLQDQLKVLLQTTERLLQENSGRSIQRMIVKTLKQVRKTMRYTTGLQTRELRRAERILSKAKGRIGLLQQKKLISRAYTAVIVLLSLESLE